MTAPPLPSGDSSHELRRLLSKLIDASLAPDEQQRLQELLLDAPELQDTYCSIMRIHALLHLDFSAGLENFNPPVLRKQLPLAVPPSDVCLLPVEPSMTPRDVRESRHGIRESGSRERRRASRRQLWFVAATAAALMLWAGVSWRTRSDQVDGLPVTAHLKPATAPSVGVGPGTPPVSTVPDRLDDNLHAIAVLGLTTGAKWAHVVPPARVGGPLLPGRFKLDEGLIQLEFFNGAVAIIEGPADFELVSAERVICRLGKIRAHVPSHAKGFTIDTPSYAAVDLGTEFTVTVEPEGVSEFHVLDGEVELWDIRPEDRVLAERLTKGKAVRSSAAGNLAKIQSPESGLVGRKQLQEITAAAQQKRHRAWLAYSQQMRTQPQVLLYYDFDGQDGWEREIRNKSSHENQLLNGAVVGCHWTTGRWSNKGALEFKRTNDRVRINVPGEYRSVSFSAWVRIEGLERWLSSLMLCDGHEQGELHWQITETGQLLLGVKADPEFSHDFYSPKVIDLSDLGRWVHIVCVYDGVTGTVHHYVDGVEVSAEKITVPTPLRIGAAEIGNWAPQDYSTYRTRSLNGRIDEFIIFNEPLSPADVTDLYEAGKPGS